MLVNSMVQTRSIPRILTTLECQTCGAHAAMSSVSTDYAQYYRCTVCDAFWGVPKMPQAPAHESAARV